MNDFYPVDPRSDNSHRGHSKLDLKDKSKLIWTCLLIVVPHPIPIIDNFRLLKAACGFPNVAIIALRDVAPSRTKQLFKPDEFGVNPCESTGVTQRILRFLRADHSGFSDEFFVRIGLRIRIRIYW